MGSVHGIKSVAFVSCSLSMKQPSQPGEGESCRSNGDGFDAKSFLVSRYYLCCAAKYIHLHMIIRNYQFLPNSWVGMVPFTA